MMASRPLASQRPREKISMSRIIRISAPLAVLCALTVGLPAQETIDFRPVAGFLKLPEGERLGPCSGVDIDSEGNVFVIQRQSPPILCFDSSGKLRHSWGAPLVGRDGDMTGAHGIRIDKDDFV